MNKKYELRYFNCSRSYYHFILLRKLDNLGGIQIPIQSEDSKLLNAVSVIHIQNLIDEGLAKKETGKDGEDILNITKKGRSVLQIHFIYYHLDLLKLEKDLGNFYSEKIIKLKKEKVKSLAVYGATDTARSLLRYLKNSGFKIVCIIDDKYNEAYDNFFGIPVISNEKVDSYTFDAILITTVVFQDQFKFNINQSFGSKYKLLSLFDV